MKTSAKSELLARAQSACGPQWRMVGGNRLRANLGNGVDGIVLFLTSWREPFTTVSISVGPRFLEIERVVAQAGRAAGLPEAHFRTRASFPTVFERLSRISTLPDNIRLTASAEIVAAVQECALPFIHRIADIETAADYAMNYHLAYGAHSMSIPVMLATAGRHEDARSYMDGAVLPDRPNYDFYARYRKKLEPLLVS